MKDLHLVWIEILFNEYEKKRAELKTLKMPDFPNIRISDKMENLLGQWDNQRQEIALSEKLLNHGKLDQVLEVFFHEVAHMLARDYFHAQNEPPHGASFCKACALLKIPAKTKMHFEPDTEQEAVRKKIEKLLALGTSPNHHEAEMALKKAQELALRYHLQAVQSNENQKFFIRPLSPTQAKFPNYTWLLMSILTKHYFCRYICRTIIGTKRKNTRILELYGRENDLELAEYVYYYLLRQAKNEWQEYKKQTKCSGLLRKSFYSGIFEGFLQKLTERANKIPEYQALALTGDPQLQTFFQKRNPSVCTRKASSRINITAHSQGLKVGKQLRVNLGVKSPKTQNKPKQIKA